MNYSNMIEEKGLKKGFIIATLVSTLVGTFTASMTLADKIQEKRDRRKQNALDGKQDGEIKQLQEKIKKLEVGDGAADEKPNKRSRSSSRRRKPRDDDYDDDEYFAYSARRSRGMIERAYEDNLMRMGEGYARGDVITENKLQAQIIQLQQTVINVLQDALYSGRSLTEGDMQRLIAAQQNAREGSLDALYGQRNRMLAEMPARRKLLPDDDEPRPLQKQSTFPMRSSSMRSLPPPRRAESLPIAQSGGLYCRYSDDLQYSARPLGAAFGPGSDGRCPSCEISLPVDMRDLWVFTSTTPTGQTREHRVDARFVVKCHTRDGRFACTLCNQHRDVDCICRSVQGLVKHLAVEHSADEFEEEVDLTTSRAMVEERRMLTY